MVFSPNLVQFQLMTKFDDKLKHLNEKLKIASIPLTIEQRGSKLCIRGVFPPKPGSSIDRPHQQRLSLHLPATIQGLKAAEAKAKEISGQLVFDKFNWEHYVPNINNRPLAKVFHGIILGYSFFGLD